MKMQTPEAWFMYSQAATAAYAAGLQPNTNNQSAYRAPTVGMAQSQAAAFDASWVVLQQFTSHPTIGFSAVLLQRRDSSGNPTGEKVIAIAGTDPSSPADLLTDLVNVADFGTVLNMPQYGALEAFYADLVSPGKLGASEQFTVTGHSLGGFLAQAFTARHSGVVSAAYTYNAPGFSGLEILQGFLGISDLSAAGKIINVHATDGVSMTAGLGIMLGSSVPVRIEASSNPLDSHSVVRLGDALAVQEAIARLQDLWGDRFQSGVGWHTALADHRKRVLMMVWFGARRAGETSNRPDSFYHPRPVGSQPVRTEDTPCAA